MHSLGEVEDIPAVTYTLYIHKFFKVKALLIYAVIVEYGVFSFRQRRKRN
jgi:hypothetical protein